MEAVVQIILALAGIYLLAGIVFAVLFLRKGVVKVDPATKDASWFFKLLLFPAMTVLWVPFLIKWRNAS